MSKKILKYIAYCILGFFVIEIILGNICVLQYRQYYKYKDYEFTIWHTLTGCYIIEGKYKSFFPPKKGYLKSKNDDQIVFFKNRNEVLMYSKDYRVAESDDSTIENKLVLYNHFKQISYDSEECKSFRDVSEELKDFYVIYLESSIVYEHNKGEEKEIKPLNRDIGMFFLQKILVNIFCWFN